jgi:hypothetical protein
LDFVYHIRLRVPGSCLIVAMSTNSPSTMKPGNRLWSIYHTDREYARAIGDPVRTVVEAPTKLIAEEAAGKLGFESPWAHPVTAEQAEQALWLPQRKRTQRQSSTRPHSRGIHV